MGKNTRGNRRNQRQSHQQNISSGKNTQSQERLENDGYVIFSFRNIDRNGQFAFDLNVIDCQNFVDKLINFSSMKWSDLVPPDGKSHHHILSPSSFSDEAKERIRTKGFDKDSDNIFSFRLGNKARLLGIKYVTIFYVVWYDPEHKFAPSKR